MVVTLPVPAEAVAQPSTTPTLTWKTNELAGKSSASFTALLRIVQRPVGGALLLLPQVTAQGLPQPVVRRAGVLVNSTTTPATAQYSPNQDTTLRSADGTVELRVPAGAYNGKLTLGYSLQATPGQFVPSPIAGWRHGLGTFFLTATNEQGRAIIKFAKPLTLTIHYTPEQLQAVGIVEGDLAIFHFDESKHSWTLLDGYADPQSKTITARIDSLPGDYQLSDGSSPSNLYLPNLQGWQVNLYTGSASYSMPIDVPSGPNGIKPSLSLSYNSSASDGDAGVRGDPAPWVGRDWSLANDSVSLNVTSADHYGTENSYTLVINGKSYDLVREGCLPGYTCGPGHNVPLSNWAWNTANEAFLRVRVAPNPTPISQGGQSNGTPYPFYKWQVWTKDGTFYEYAADAWWGWNDCVLNPPTAASMQEYKWNLSRVVDVYNNTTNYNYAYSAPDPVSVYCDATTVSGNIDWNVAPASITWGGNLGAGTPDRYRVDFIASARQYDNSIAYDTPDNQLGIAPHEYLQLNAVKVSSNRTGSNWEQVRQYNFTYDYSLYSDYSDTNHNPDPTTMKLTLLSVQRQGSDSSVLPTTTFAYTPGSLRGNAQYPVPSWNRLIAVDNHQGGKVTFGYENIDQVTGRSEYNNRRRVISRTLYPRTWDNSYPSYTWTYAYTHPAFNWLGNEGDDPNPNSAQVWYAHYIDSVNGMLHLVHPRLKEFRGHADVVETDPNGNQTEHKFIQGGNNCTPVNTNNDTCWNALLGYSFIVGQEYDTIHRAGAGSHTLSEVVHNFLTYYYDMGGIYTQPMSGIWHGFEFENQTVNTSWGLSSDNGGSWVAKAKTTNYLYETAAYQYGRLLSQAEYDATNTRVRKTNYQYDTNVVESGTYIADRQSEEDVLDQNNNYLAVSLYGYDNLPIGQVGMQGSLTRKLKFYDVPLATSIQGITLHGADATYGYDASYGNQTTATTYTGPGTGSLSGSAWTLSTPGQGSTPRTTTTTYDGTFHAFPTQMTHPTVNGVTLTDQAGYDYHMGVMTQTVDFNLNVSNADYDSFGRLVKLIKPGDSESIPTVQAIYSDTAVPFQYIVARQEVAGQSGANRPSQMFYDGLGQQIQTKDESQGPGGEQNIVADNVYDGIGDKTGSTQPRYVANTSCSFWSYCPLPGSGLNWTITSYDALSRQLVVTNPDTTATSMTYWMPPGGNGPATTRVDGNLHKQQSFYDILGRLTLVSEFTGTNPWTWYANTSYTYSPLDLLTQTQDNVGNTAHMYYDSLGRKTSISDPDMGSFGYVYDPNGNLTQQTDAKGQVISFSYDLLDRMTQTGYSTGDATDYYHYDEATFSNGKGERTSIVKGAASTQWGYDAKRNANYAAYQITTGGSFYSYQWAYDSGNRLSSITYPGGEQVSYTYDNGWRPNRMYFGGKPVNCYVCNAHYTALNLPLDQTYGNGVVQSWAYSSPMQRLSSLTVGTAGGGYNNYFNRSYNYDGVGNVRQIINNFQSGEVQTNYYDSLDRLTNWTTSTGVNEVYQYDTIGNLTSKAGTAYTYGANGNGTGAGPHQARSVGGQSYSYDANGNLNSGGGRSYTWNADNQPSVINYGVGQQDTYTYNADGSRVIKQIPAGPSYATTYYISGLYEVDSSGAIRTMYQFGGQVVAERVTGNGPGGQLYYLHGDHLGSVALTTDSSGNLVSSQEFKPWGEVRSGGVSQTTINYTGQKLDSTGLLYYNARYYDPSLARFLSPDTVVSSAKNPQSWNRYSYVQNNPLRYVDPNGHCRVDGDSRAANDPACGVQGSSEYQYIQRAESYVPISQSELDAAYNDRNEFGNVYHGEFEDPRTLAESHFEKVDKQLRVMEEKWLFLNSKLNDPNLSGATIADINQSMDKILTELTRDMFYMAFGFYPSDNNPLDWGAQKHSLQWLKDYVKQYLLTHPNAPDGGQGPGGSYSPISRLLSSLGFKLKAGWKEREVYDKEQNGGGFRGGGG